MLKDKDLFITGNEDFVITPGELSAIEQEQGMTEDKTKAGDVTQAAVTVEPGQEAGETTETQKAVEDVENATKEAEDVSNKLDSEEKTIASILDELENLGKSQEQQTEKEAAVQKTAEEIKTAEQNGEDTSELIAKLQQEVIELRNERKKASITTDFLQEQVEALHKENLQYKYGRVDEDGLINLINNDSNLKTIISQTIKSQDNPAEKAKLVNLYKNQLEKLTGLDFTDFIESQNKKVEGEMASKDEDVADNISMDLDGESLFI